MKKGLILLLWLGTALAAFSQAPKLENTLLWRISGKGLPEPSYLYGTMHLTDKRVFQLGDSVYKAIERTKGLATEIDMLNQSTRMAVELIGKQQEDEEKDSVLLRHVVNPEVWEKYKEQLGRKMKKDYNQITVSDVTDRSSRIKSTLFRKGEMPTFLDAWLSGVAMKQGKWVGGVEDMDDQAFGGDDMEEDIQNLLFDQEYGKGLEGLLKVYVAQRLDYIDSMMYRSDSAKKDFIIIRRNRKMARRMDSLMSIRSTLFAIGAGHLPGDSGLITLLRKRGYTVTPVFSSKKISAEQYQYKAVETEWKIVTDPENGYTMKMPGDPESLPLPGLPEFAMKTYFDLLTMKMYFTIGMPVAHNLRSLGPDTLFERVKQRFGANSAITAEKKIMVSGVGGEEITLISKEVPIRLQLLAPDSAHVMMNMLVAFTEESMHDKDAEKFFQSFTYVPVTSVPAPEDGWTRQAFTRQSFSVEVPMKAGPLRLTQDDNKNPVYAWQGVDKENAIVYGMSVTNLRKGFYYSEADSSRFRAMVANLVARQQHAKLLDSAALTVNGYAAHQYLISSKSENDSIHTTLKVVFRGGITYFIFAVFAPDLENTERADRYLRSLQLLPYNHPAWAPVTSPDQVFSTRAPASFVTKPLVENDIHPGATRYAMYDSLAAINMYVDKIPLPDWFGYLSDTAFLRTRTHLYYSYSDSIADYRVVQSNQGPTVSFTVFRPGVNMSKLVKILLNKDTLYEMFGDVAVQDTSLYLSVYDHFRLSNPQPPVSSRKINTGLLSSQLRTADTSGIERIKGWWNQALFRMEDLPALERLSVKLYPDFDTNYYNYSFNKQVLETIEELDTAHTMLRFIKEQYGKIGTADEYIKPFLIGYLSRIETAESYAILKECLLKYPMRADSVRYFSHSLYDSLGLTATLYPELLSVAETPGLWRLVCGTAASLLDSNLLAPAAIQSGATGFINLAKKELAKGLDYIADNNYSYTDLIRLLGIINTAEANNLLRQFAATNDQELLFHSTVSLIKNNQPVDAKTIKTLATDAAYLSSLFDELSKLNKLNLLPAEYKTQVKLGESSLYQYASDDDEVPDAIMPVGERMITYKGNKVRVFLFKVEFGGDEKTYYLGVAGPFAADRQQLKSDGALTGIYYEKEYNQKELDAQLRDYLDSMESDD